MHRRTLLAAPLLLAHAARAQAAPLVVDHVWSRAAMAGRVGVVYLSITATGAPDTLVSVSSPIAPKAELHESYDDNGVMKMRPVASLTVAPGKPIVLRPGGYHIMLVDLAHALKEGDSFPITLHFADAGPVTVTASVEKAGASVMPAPSANMPGMKM
jgi:periplasmic copper chaperone A